MRYWCIAITAGGFLFAGSAATLGNWGVFVLSAMAGIIALLVLFLLADKGEG